MKKSMKLATVAMATSLCAIGGILCGTQTFAHASSVSVEDMKTYLASINMPEVYLRLASDEEIERDYRAYYGNEDIVVESSVSYLRESGENGVIPLDIISEDEMAFTVTATPELIRSNGVTYIDCVSVMVTYEWTKLPRYRKNDAIVVNWDSNEFTFLNGSFYQFDTRVIGSGSSSYEEHNVIQRPCEIAQGGIGYEFSLKADSSPVTGISGYARFILSPKKEPMYPEAGIGTRYITSVNAQYCHLWYLFSPSVGFSKDDYSVSFSLQKGTDTTATGCTFSYWRE